MSFIEKIKQAFQSQNQEDVVQEELVLTVDEVVDHVERVSDDKLESIDEREKHLASEVESVLDDLRNNLEDVGDYEDVEGIKAAEDIASSFYNSRSILIENFNLDENAEDLEKSLEAFLTDFNDVDRKEKALMDRMKSDVVGIAQNVQRLGELLEDLNHFTDNALNYRKDYEKLKRVHSEIENVEKEVSSVNDDHKELEEKLESLNNSIRDKKDELSDLTDSEDWEEKQNLEEELKQVKNDKKSIEKTLSNTVSSLDRGLKKLVYQIENQGMSFEGSKTQLEAFRNQNYSELDMVKNDLELAQQKIEEQDLLEDRQLEEFREKAGNLDFEDSMNSLENKEERLDSLRTRIDGLDVVDEKESLETVLEELKDKQSKRKEELESLQTRKEELNDRIMDKKRDLEQQARKILQQPVKIQ